MFEGDSSKISSALGVPEGVITSFVSSEELTLPKAVLGLKKKKTKHGYFSMKNYNKQLITAVQKDKKGELFPWCLPCTHPGTSRTASCLENTIFCTKACGQGEYNPNYFRGCNCSGSCDSNSCSCFAANRECDPDLCKACGACSDTTKLLPVSGQRCKNDNITMSRHQRLLVGISSIPGAGWGLFTKNRLKRGDFIQEYTGELIATDEADRRGVIYDEQNLSYLFDQSKEYAIDAIRKGSKARFANHSLEPNVDTKYLFVNGDFRIAFVANQNIDAQTEVSECFLNCKLTLSRMQP